MKKTPAVIAGVFLLFTTYISIPSVQAACGNLSALYDPATYTSGTTLNDQSGCGSNGTLIAGTPVKTALPARFVLNQGSTGKYFYQSSSVANPTTYSIAIWFRTTSASGTKLMGFVQNTGTTETSYDRHLFIGRDGKLFYGVYNGNSITVASTSAVNDGKWHLAVATQSGSVGRLYLDTATAVTLSATPQSYTGYWKVGGYVLTGWSDNTGALSTGDWVGDVGKTYIYNATQISAADVTALYEAGRSMYVSPTTSIALSSGTSAVYRSATNLQFTSGIDGKVTFFQNNKRIAGCISMTTSSGAATCPWKPSLITSATSLYAKMTPFDTATATMTTSAISVPVLRRTNNR